MRSVKYYAKIFVEKKKCFEVIFIFSNIIYLNSIDCNVRVIQFKLFKIVKNPSSVLSSQISQMTKFQTKSIFELIKILNAISLSYIHSN